MFLLFSLLGNAAGILPEAARMPDASHRLWSGEPSGGLDILTDLCTSVHTTALGIHPALAEGHPPRPCGPCYLRHPQASGQTCRAPLAHCRPGGDPLITLGDADPPPLSRREQALVMWQDVEAGVPGAAGASFPSLR